MEYARPATWDDVKQLAQYGFNRFSEDIDILVNPSAENSRRWIAALSKLPDGAAHELAAEIDVFADDKRYAIRINDEFTVDVMPSIAGLGWEEMRQHITTLDLDGARISLLDLPGLLKTKQGVRPKDQMDAAVIAAALAAMRNRSP